MKTFNARQFPANCSLLLALFLILHHGVLAQPSKQKTIIAAARAVISRAVDTKLPHDIHFSVNGDQAVNGEFAYHIEKGQLYVSGNSAVALCHGFYDYLKTSGRGMISWSGSTINLEDQWTPVEEKHVVSPYQYHYYMNVVTHGYSTPYWNWNRWEQELDWMALHGMDMLLMNNAYEAIMFRVFKKIGLQESDIRNFFTGPAFQPWNRMGNLSGWDGPPPASWYEKQIALTHRVLDRMHQLQMTPIIQSFAGFVPKEIAKLYPDAEIVPMVWVNGFEHPGLLLPNKKNAALFTRIGSLFIQEFEKEFGKAHFYLADSFNEMKVPRKPGDTEEGFQQQLSEYGDVVYQSIKGGDSDAVWTMQGWTFGYDAGNWSPARLQSLVSKVPDDRVLFLDLANDYNLNFWHIKPSWENYHGFFNKSWIYSFIPNMGGKTAWNGILKTYAEAPATALHYSGRGNLVGFGFAPEGIENNELIYELLTDVGWRDTKIELDDWLKNYCQLRYGTYSANMRQAYNLFLKSCYGTFTDHPRFTYQLNATGKSNGSVNRNPEFFEGVRLFLSCAAEARGSILYKNDAIELSAQYLSLVADSLIRHSFQLSDEAREHDLTHAYSLLSAIDRLLLSHTTDRLDRWVNYARAFGDNAEEKQYYTQDARRIITTWGPGINDYAAKMWGGLLQSYYLPRLQASLSGKSKSEVKSWEDNWVKNGGIAAQSPFEDPVGEAGRLVGEER